MPSLSTRDGSALFYRDWGRGRPVVFVHSMLMSSDMWQQQLLWMADHGYRAIAYDRRGHGRSDDPGTGYDFDTLADDLATLLDTLGLTEVTLVGHSMGGGEVVRYLSRHGARRVARVALVASTVPRLHVDADSRAALLTRLRSDYGRWVADNAGLSFGDGLPGAAIAELDRERTVRDWLGVSQYAAVACTAANLAADFSAELSAIEAPMLIVHGDHDAFAPVETCGRRSARLARNGTLLVYRNAAHMLQLSHRDRLNNDLLAFVRAAR
ncbi:alpha/beta fold hydrolase [Actinocatenispora sera]|uniref:Arylesterase n=1 Tax=Actinocatenispora sera TaxID=390989 RepID=A0A810L335_9ACTN|nr:alpha/beta hydrolase [Actinocatenispora sera]BCJ28811.1 arylesterase [Actinocatenispora sera]